MDAAETVARMPIWFVLSVVIILAASIGSFLNVVIWRLPRGGSLLHPGSHCPGCEQPIAWYDNVPILSWLLLRGRCRRCGTGIDARYVMVEVLTTCLAVACWAVFGPTFEALRAFVLCALLVPLTYIDLEHWLLPHALTWPGIGFGLATAGLGEAGPGWGAAAIGAAAGFLGFWLVRVVGTLAFKREAMGFGDLFLLALLGAFLGWRPLAPLVFLASLQGAIVGVSLMVLTRRTPEDPETLKNTDDSEVVPDEEPAERGEETPEEEEDWVPPPGSMPFGPFLALAGLEMLFFGPEVLAWVLGLMGL
ncbi:MAG: prepilin peptidase [Deltaproteobacteria bacterium]|nr:prepilin peptidase [Deltaproteobacteria bacterium]